MDKIPRMMSAVEGGDAKALKLSASPKLSFNRTAVLTGFKAVIKAYEAGEIDFENAGDGDTVAEAVEQLARAAHAVATMKTGQTFGWFLRNDHARKA